MNWIDDLLRADSVAHAVLMLSLIAACGLGLGRLRLFGIGLGVAGVLFAGLIFGHFGVTINAEVLDFTRDFGLILFVYTIGLQVGPGFLSSLRQHGLALNLMAASVVLLGVAVTLGVAWLGHIPLAVAVGLFAGGTTNTPSLAAAQQALASLPNVADETAKLPALGYAIAYPFGVVGIILTMLMLRLGFRINVAGEVDAIAAQQQALSPKLTTRNLEVQNPNLNGLALEKLPALAGSGVVISRVLHDNHVAVAEPATVLEQGDVLLGVGPREQLDQLQVVVGKRSERDLKEVPGPLTTQRILVTQGKALGRTVDELDLLHRYGVTITRISRAEVEFTPGPGVRLQFGDTVRAVGEAQAIEQVAAELGNSVKQLQHAPITPIFVGLALGVVLGSCPIHLPGVPAPVKLGLAGGPLLVAILLSRLGRVGPLIWYMPASANMMLRELGIVLFLACVGLHSGDRFVEVLTRGGGWGWMAWAALITLLPLLLVALFARIVHKLNFATLCGLLAGSMTDPPALAFAGTLTNSDYPLIAYASIYPLVMLLRVIAAQVMVLLFVR